MLKHINLPEAAGALFILLLGVAVIVIAQDYSMGTLNRMGPGYFPVVLGALLVVLGVSLLVEVWRLPVDDNFHFPFRPVVMVGLGLCAFAVLVERAGLVPATFALIGLSCLAESPFRPLTTLIIASSMSLMGVFLFIKLLGLPLAAFGG